MVSCSFSFSSRRVAYLVGCRGRNAPPKHAEKVGTGAVIPRSVPATLAVNPEMKWYIAWPVESLATGGRTPNASHVRKMHAFGWPPLPDGSWFGMWWSG